LVRRASRAVLALVLSSASCQLIAGLNKPLPGAAMGTDSCDVTAAGSSSGDPPDAGYATCDGAAVDLRNDHGNCGWCGHDCLESTCSGGWCQPTTVADDDGGIRGIVGVRSNALFYFTSTTAVRKSLDTGSTSVMTQLDADAGVFNSGVVDESGIYMSVYCCGGGGYVLGVPSDGSPSAKYPFWGTGIALNGTEIFLTPPPTIDSANSVFAAPKGAPDAGRRIATGENTPGEIVADDEHAFWLNQPNYATAGADSGTQGGLVVYTTATDSVAPPIPLSGTPRGLASDGLYLYWFEATTGEVKRLPKASPSDNPTVLAKWSGALFAYAMNVTRGALYWLARTSFNINPAVIVSAPRCGGTPRIVSGDSAFWGTDLLTLAADDRYIYWSTIGGKIYRVAQ
jgi:hypothetical protein